MFVRTASTRDLDAVRALLGETWHATYDSIYGPGRVAAITAEWHSLPSLREQLDRPRSEFLVADDGKVIGGMAYASADESGRTVVLHQLYVRPAFQGRGVGGMLLEEIDAGFPEAETIRLEVEEANVRALAFYRATGFAQVGRTANCGRDRSGIPALVFERRRG